MGIDMEEQLYSDIVDRVAQYIEEVDRDRAGDVAGRVTDVLLCVLESVRIPGYGVFRGGPNTLIHVAGREKLQGII